MDILPIEASRGKKLLLSSTCEWAATVPAEVTIDENGAAIIPITGLLPGQTTINMVLEDSSLVQQLDVEVIF